jgi:NADH:ubiquinone oxidoreductase subunit C
MNKTATTIETLKEDIRNFYNPNLHHFIVMNAVDLGAQIEVQWFFSDYAPPYAITTFFALVNPDTVIPSIRDMVTSAWVAEAELVDLMDIRIENTQKGFVLEPDFESGPLRKSM